MGSVTGLLGPNLPTREGLVDYICWTLLPERAGFALSAGCFLLFPALWCFGPLSDGPCFKPSLLRGRDVRDKGHKGPQGQYSTHGHAIGVIPSVIRAAPRDRWAGQFGLGPGFFLDEMAWSFWHGHFLVYPRR